MRRAVTSMNIKLYELREDEKPALAEVMARIGAVDARMADDAQVAGDEPVGTGAAPRVDDATRPGAAPQAGDALKRGAAPQACAAPSDITIDAVPDELGLENVASAQGFDAVVISGRSAMTAEVLDRLAELGVKYLATRTVGVDHIDVAHAHELGLRVCNTGYPPEGVAEFAVMLMLIVLRRYKPTLWRQQVNDYSLGGLEGRELGRLTVGIVGTGRIGQQVARILGGFGSKVLGYDPYPSDAARAAGIEYVPLEELYRRSDVVTLHVPLTEENRGMIDAEAINQMRDGVVLVNVSRGELIDVAAVTSAIEFEKIGALAMDVFADEVGIYHESRVNDIIRNRDMAYLRQFPNVVLTPHMAFYTDTNVNSMVEQGVRGVIAMAEGPGSWASEV